MQVPFVALDRQHVAIRDELDAAFARVVGSSAFVLGSEVEAFEAEFAAYCGADHCVGVSNGTAALGLALQAMGIGAGDEVVLPAHTFIASALGVMHAGATPVFCEVDDDTGLMDPDAAAAAITDRTAALLPVHLYGQVCDMQAITQLADSRGLAVLEDAAQAHGATDGGARAGSFGTAAGFSFYPSKNLGALGDGGAIVTRDPDVDERARRLRNLGQRAKGEHVVAGRNERLDGLQAALLRAKLPHLDGWNEARRRHAAELDGLLAGTGLRLLAERADAECIYHLYPVRAEDRDELAASLRSAGVQTGVHYSPACFRQPPVAALGAPGEFPVADAWAARELSLPMFPELTSDEIAHVAQSCSASVAAA